MSEVTLNVIDHLGNSRQLIASTGQVLMHVLRDEVDINVGICGGEISCGTCLVRLTPDWAARIAAPGEDEQDMLDALGAGDHARLGCQLILDAAADGMQATILHEE